MQADSSFESPVAGSMKHDKSPTSGDVHLYADPETAYTRLPMLYADCEGLSGGEMEPAANKLRQKNKNPYSQGRPNLFKSQPRDVLTGKSNNKTSSREHGPHLFKILSAMVASSIFTDCIRASRPGE